MSGWLWGSKNKIHADPSVEKHLMVLKSPSSFDERRESFAAIKELSKEDQNHELLGKSVPFFVGILRDIRRGKRDSLTKEEMYADQEILREILDLLINVMTLSEDKNASYVEMVNTEQFVQDSQNLSTVVELLEERSFYVRWGCVKLLMLLLTNEKIQQVQDCVLTFPMSVDRLVTLLTDEREILRNEGLLLLQKLTYKNQELQKIVAFTGAFEKLFEIIETEGLNEGPIIVADCLSLINNLLEENVSNQNYFREIGCINRLPPLLKLERSDFWLFTDVQASIFVLTLQVISNLVVGPNPNSSNNQALMNKLNIFKLVVDLALLRVNSPIIRIQALITTGDLILCHLENRTAFGSLRITLDKTSRETFPAMNRLLLVALNSTEFRERTAAVHIFQSYLSDNQEGQIFLATTLNPTPTVKAEDDASDSIGRHLLSALFGWLADREADMEKKDNNSIKSWISSCILAYILKDNIQCKELILRIPLEIATKPGVPVANLLSKTMDALKQATSMDEDVSVRVGLLSLLSYWMFQSVVIVKSFLSNPKNLPFLVEQVIQPTTNVHIAGLSALLVGFCYQFNDNSLPDSNKAALHSIMTHRIGIDKYLSKFDYLRKTDLFIHAEQGRTWRKISEMSRNETNTNSLSTDHNSASWCYDYDFTVFFKDCYDKIQRDLRTPKAIGANMPQPSMHSDQAVGVLVDSYKELIKSQEEEINFLKKKIQELESKSSFGTSTYLTQSILQNHQQTQDQMRQQLERKNLEIESLTAQVRNLSAQVETLMEGNSTLTSLSNAYTDLELILAKKEHEILELQIAIEQQKAAASSSTKSEEDERFSLQLIKELQETNENMENMITLLTEENEKLKTNLSQSNQVNKETDERLKSLEQEQEEILSEMAKLEIHNNNLRERLLLLDPESAT